MYSCDDDVPICQCFGPVLEKTELVWLFQLKVVAGFDPLAAMQLALVVSAVSHSAQQHVAHYYEGVVPLCKRFGKLEASLS